MAHGKLQLAMPMEKVREMSNLSLMVSYPTLFDLDVSILLPPLDS